MIDRDSEGGSFDRLWDKALNKNKTYFEAARTIFLQHSDTVTLDQVKGMVKGADHPVIDKAWESAQKEKGISARMKEVVVQQLLQEIQMLRDDKRPEEEIRLTILDTINRMKLKDFISLLDIFKY